MANMLSNLLLIVDENLFYKGVDKSIVHGARLHQSASVPDATDTSESSVPASSDDAEAHPPYPFESGNSLLALCKKHNVSPLV